MDAPEAQLVQTWSVRAHTRSLRCYRTRAAPPVSATVRSHTSRRAAVMLACHARHPAIVNPPDTDTT
jgi:hypothetical protein